MVIKLKVTFPETCPACNTGTLWYEYREGITTHGNVTYICDHCSAEYDWNMLASIMLERGIADGQRFTNGLMQ